ncbi:MAG: flippase-like domain-containing protein [Verrucomicrobia bacterium]|nr:flippase-like domain-containing protein [Verrucomicrobiota bacterium]
MNKPKKTWKTLARVGVGVLLLVWIFHSIFVNEARQQAKRGELPSLNGQQIDGKSWAALPRPDQWRYGWRYGPPALAAALGGVEPGAFVLSVGLVGLALFIGVVRWRMVLRVQGLDLPLGRATKISLVAHFFNAFLLGTAGGDVAKAYYAAQETHHRKTEAVLTVLMDRILGLWAMLLFASLMIVPNWGLFAKPGLRTAAAFTVAMTCAATGFVYLAFWGGVSRAWPKAHEFLRRLPKGEWLERTLESCRSFGRDRLFVLRAVGLSMLLNLLVVLQFVVLARGLHLQLPPLALYLVVPLVICISALPISPSGLGVRENLFVQLLAAATIGAPATLSLSLSLLAYAGSLAWSVVGGVAYMTFRDRHRLRELVEEEPT